jgi:hypothetical protein
VTEAQANEAVFQQWLSVWPGLQPSVPFCFENEKFVEPTTGAWARVTLRGLDSIQETLGKPTTRRYERMCAVWVQLFVPVNTGTELVKQLVDSARAVYEGVQFGNGVKPAGGCRTTVVGSDGKWYEVVVVAPVNYYETR